MDIIRKKLCVIKTKNEFVLISGQGCSSHVTAIYQVVKWNQKQAIVKWQQYSVRISHFANILIHFINQLTTIWIEMTILYEPEISTAGHYEPEIPTASHYEITASHYEFKNGAS